MLLRITLVMALGVVSLAQTMRVTLDSAPPGKAQKVNSEAVTYKGRKAIRLTDALNGADANEDRLLVLTQTKFENGTIEVDVAGEPAPGAGQGARGFTGIAFRVAPDVTKFECFYVRPTNGRADDQVRRNHSVQYISFPDHPWHRLRKEFPEKYESYADLVPGEWTKVKIEVMGRKAKLFVNGVEQPTLIVNDLKHSPAEGAIGLWIGPGTVAHFSNLNITRN